MSDDNPAPATMDQRVAEVRERLKNVTPGPWFVWDGPSYAGGGRDLCIGAGPTWLANMDHRSCRRRVEHMETFATCSVEEETDVCSVGSEITAEQIANAQFIARAREDVPFLLSAVDYLDKQRDELMDEIDRLKFGREEPR